MKLLLIALMVIASVAVARIDVYFGEVRCDTLQVDSVATFAGIVELGDTLKVDGIQFDATLFFWDVDGDREFQIDSTGLTSVHGELYVEDTLAVGTAAPEYFFHVSDTGAYPALFEGDATGATWVAVDNNHATAECGFSIWRAGTQMWTIEDSNGTFIIYDSDDTANRLTIDGTTGNFVIYQNLSVNSDFFVTDSVGIGGDVFVTGNFVSDMVAPTYNFATASEVSGSGDSIVVNFAYDIPALAPGLTIEFIAEAANTGATILYLDGGAGKNVYEASDISALEANDIRDTQVVRATYDGTQWQQISQSGN